MLFYRSLGVLRVEKEESYILALHGIAISCFYILLSILLRLAEWFAMTITGWGGLAEGFPWWIILPLTVTFYPPVFIYYRENLDQVNPKDDLITALLLIPLLLIGYVVLSIL